MSQAPGEFEHENVVEPEINFRRFVDTLEAWSVNPWNEDEGIAAFSQAVLNSLPDNIENIYKHGIEEIYASAGEDGQLPPSQEFLLMAGNYLNDKDDPSAVDSRTNTTVSYKVRKLYHAVRFIRFMMRDERLMETRFDIRQSPRPEFKYSYPEDYDKPEAFTELIEIIMDNPDLGDLVTWALERYRIRTTVIPRYLVPKLTLIEEFDDRPIRMGSVGVGSGHGEKALMGNVQFDDVEFMRSVAGTSETPTVDIELTEELNAKKDRHLKIEELMGFDLWGVNDVAQANWIEASLLLREHKNEKLMDKYRQVAGVKSEGLAFHILDFTSEEAVDEFLKHYRQEHGEMPQLDAFLAITMVYQLKTDEERRTAYKNMAKFLRPEGFILIQDSLDGSFESPYSYMAIKSYPHMQDVEPQIIACSRDDRCEQIIIPGRS